MTLSEERHRVREGGRYRIPWRNLETCGLQICVPHHTPHRVLSHLIAGMLAHTCPPAGALLPQIPSPGVQAAPALSLFSGPGARLGARGRGGVCGLFQPIWPSECAPWFSALWAAYGTGTYGWGTRCNMTGRGGCSREESLLFHGGDKTVCLGRQHVESKLRPPRGTWVAQSVKRPTLDFGSGHDLTVREFKPRIGLCTHSEEPALDPLSPSLCPSPACILLSLSLSLSKINKCKQTNSGHL